MAIGSTLIDKLSTLGIHVPPWPEDPEDSSEAGDWILRGQAYADVVDQWRARLRNARSSTKVVVHELLRHSAGAGELGGWDRWVASVMLPLVCKKNNTDDWMFTAAAHSSSLMSPAQLLGATLVVAEQSGWPGSSCALQYLFEHEVSEAEQIPRLIALLIESTGDSTGNDDTENRFEQWINEVAKNQEKTWALRVAIECLENRQCYAEFERGRSRLIDLLKVTPDDSTDHGVLERKSQCATCLEIEAGLMLAHEGRGAEVIDRIERLVQQSEIQTPEGTSKPGWTQLLTNAAAGLTNGGKRLLLIESESLPRTGHHYLKQVLQAAWKENFSYCERYQEPGCCQLAPCNAEAYWQYARRHHNRHLRLVKSHDFELRDPAYNVPPGVVRLIQVRQPYNLLTSWLELEQLALNKALLGCHGISVERICLYHEKELLAAAYSIIDEQGVTMCHDETVGWIHEKSEYIVRFSQKWLPHCESMPRPRIMTHGTYLVRYEDFGIDIKSIAHAMASSEEAQSIHYNHPPFCPRVGSTLHRTSKLISQLLMGVEQHISMAECHILSKWQDYPQLSSYQQTASRKPAKDITSP